MSILKASGLSELLKEYDVDVSPKNMGRFSKNYGIKKDPNRPSASGFYLEPTEKQLEKISSQYEKNILKAPGSTEAGKEAFKKRETRAKELLTKGYNQTEADNILKKEFNMSMKTTLTKVANDLKEEGIKVVSGRESEIKTPASKFLKKRRELQKSTSDPYKEKLITEAKREAGFGNYDLAHRLSMQQNKILGTELISSNLGLDTKKINREIIKPIENELEKIYKKQISVANKIKKEGASSELRKELESLNKQVSEVVATTDGRLQGIHIDEYNLKPKTIGIDYAKSFGAGVIPDKPVSQLTKEEIQLAIKQIPGQLEAIKKEPSLTSRMSNQLGFGPSGMIDVGEEVVEDVKGIYGKYAPQIAKGALTGLKVIGTPLASTTFYAGDVGRELKQAADEGNLTAKKALDAFVGQGEKGLYFFLPELAKDVVTNPIANKILQLGKIGRFATPTGAVLSTVGVAKDFYDQYKEFQALSPEEKEKRIKESTYTPTEQDFLQMQEAESRASAATGGRINFAEGSTESKEGGFVEFGDPETWDEKFSEFTKRAVHSRPVEKNQSTIFGKYANQIAETRLGPEDPLSKYKSYSEEELLGNIEAKRPNQLQSFSLEDYRINTMPMFEPRDVAPPKSYSPMPVEKYLRGREYMDLAKGGIASMFRKRPGYAEGETVEYDDSTDLYNQALEENRRQEGEKGALARQKFNDYLKEKTGYENIDAYYQDPGYQSYNPRAADKDITKAIYDNINLQGYKPFGYEDTPFEFGFDQDPNAFYQLESGYDSKGNYTPKRIRPYTSEEKQSVIKNNVENELYRQGLFDQYGFGFSKDRQPTIESSKFFLDQLQNLQGRDSDFEDVIKKGNYIDRLESNLRSMYDKGEYQKLQETLDPGYSKYASDYSKINRAFNVGDVLANYDSATGKIDSSIYAYLSDAERNIIQQSQGLPTYLTGYAQQLIQDTRNRKQESENQRTAAAERYNQLSNLPNTQYSLSDELGFERPQIDPFSGQQVSAQDQMSFTQPQDIFPQQKLPTVTPEAPFQPYQAEPSNVGIFAGPSYDKYSQARTDAYANAPSKFDYDVTANQAAGQFIQDRAREIYGDNVFGKGIGTLGAVAGVPLAMFSSPFHEAAQVVMEGRMKPGSGIEGFYKAFMNELPFSTAANRAVGVMRSIPGVGESIYQGAYGQTPTQTYDLLKSQVTPYVPNVQAGEELKNQYLNRLSQIQSSGPTVDPEFKNLLQSKLEVKKG